ncbi:MAG: tetratricopeptide repeat protein, partial [Thermoanaerobaculia bacterium]
ARGLAAAHEELIIHRDVKPENIVVLARDTVKILDFGLAKLLGPARSSGDGIIGTPAYMAPEQIRGEPVDHRVDIWALGVLFYEMLTSHLPFRGGRIEAVIHSILNDDAPRASDELPLPSKADRIIARSLAKSVRARYERMDDMIADLADMQLDVDAGALTVRRAAVQKKTSVAILPFVDMSSEKDQEYLCDGITEEILAALRPVPELYVASRTSAFQFKGRAVDIREIGHKLNVDTVLEGSVRRAGERLRISAQLVNVDDGYRLWYERYDRELRDIFAIEDEIAERIARSLEVTLVAKPQQPVSTSETEAWEIYLQGRQFFHQHRKKGYEIALQTFQRVIELDPRYARAYAGIADSNSFLWLYFGYGKNAVEAADRASLKALELEPDLAESRCSRGLALFVTGKIDDAERELARSIALDPSLYDAHYIFGRVEFSRGQPAEAARHFREACAIDPEAYDSWYLLGMCYRRTGETAKARSADLACIEAAKRRIRLHPDDTRAWTMAAAIFVELGEPDRAAEWVARAVSIDPDETIILYNAACVYLALGKIGESLTCLENSVGHGGLSLEWATNDPDLDRLRGQPRFEALLARAPQPG